MKRRDFIKSTAAVAAASTIPAAAGAKEPAPPYMPILEPKMEKGGYLPYYHEREITEPVLLCEPDGTLNPESVGWSRFPLTRANLKGHWPRKKKWNFWNFISPDFVYSITIAHIDYLCFCGISLIDFTTGEEFSALGVNPLARSSAMPEMVEETVKFKGSGVVAELVHHGDHIKVDSTAGSGKRAIVADFKIIKPEGHQTLNIVVPWTDERFQMNSKHNTLPLEGKVTVGDREWKMDPATCHGVQDFGRGMWPYRSHWNWGVATGTVDGHAIGINTGDKWTTGTGSNENGICYDGILYKVMEDLEWTYDPDDWMSRWRIKSNHTDAIDLTLTPVHVGKQNLSLGPIRTGGACAYGHYNGTVKFGGKTVKIENLIGWAEQFIHRW